MLNCFTKQRPVLVLAPMEGVTDAPMRAVLTESGDFDFCVTEFIRVTDQELPAKVFHRMVPELKTGGVTRSGTPVVVQLLGGDPDFLALNAQTAVRLGANALDLNFGCPAPTVNRHDGGATLLKYPERIRKIVSSVRVAVPPKITVSAKLRLGWEDPKDILRNAEAAVSGGASWLTIHARTRMQGYSPPVRWEWIGEVKRAVSVPVIANGDIRNWEDYRRCHELTGADGYMLGRGAMGNPELPKLIRRQAMARPGAWQPWLEKFLQETADAEPMYQVRRIKQWLRMAQLTQGDERFERIKRCRSVDEMISELKGV